jgi:hypothetical protein
MDMPHGAAVFYLEEAGCVWSSKRSFAAPPWGVILADFGVLTTKVVWIINVLYYIARGYTPFSYWIRRQLVSTSSYRAEKSSVLLAG